MKVKLNYLFYFLEINNKEMKLFVISVCMHSLLQKVENQPDSLDYLLSYSLYFCTTLSNIIFYYNLFKKYIMLKSKVGLKLENALNKQEFLTYKVHGKKSFIH